MSMSMIVISAEPDPQWEEWPDHPLCAAEFLVAIHLMDGWAFVLSHSK